MYIDTHCHLSIEDYDDIDLVIKEDNIARVSPIIISGCTKSSIIESLDLVHKYNDLYATIGYHPSEVNDIYTDDINVLKKQLLEEKIVGVGEIGLDYHYGKEDINLQKDLFKCQLKIAEELNLPVVIHSRDATMDTINILKEFPKVHGVIHCFSGSLETAREYISMGYLLGIGGVVTFKNSNLPNVVKSIGLSNIVLETDSPYLTPSPYRGEKNSSKYIPIIAEKIADILNVPISEVEKITTNNASSLFDFKRNL